jgi:membrane protease YdiL (CAAX protease family)
MRRITLSKVRQNCLVILIAAELLINLELLMAWLGHQTGEPTLLHLLKQLIPYPQFLALGVLLGGADLALNYGLLLRLFKLPEEPGELEPLSYPNKIVYASFTGLTEEILVRGVIQSIVGVWATAIFFGLGHCTSLRKVLWTLFWGLVYGAAVYYTDNLWVVIIPHAMGNFAYACECGLPKAATTLETSIKQEAPEPSLALEPAAPLEPSLASEPSPAPGLVAAISQKQRKKQRKNRSKKRDKRRNKRAA